MPTEIIRPNGLVSNNFWTPVGAASLWEAIDEDRTQPAQDGDISDYDLTHDIASVHTMDLAMTTVAGVQKVTGIKVWVYAKVIDPSHEAHYGLLCGWADSPAKYFEVTEEWAWSSVEWGDLDLSQAELDGLEIDLTASGDIGVDYQVATMYAEITYTLPGQARRGNQMTGGLSE